MLNYRGLLEDHSELRGHNFLLIISSNIENFSFSQECNLASYLSRSYSYLRSILIISCFLFFFTSCCTFLNKLRRSLLVFYCFFFGVCKFLSVNFAHGVWVLSWVEFVFTYVESKAFISFIIFCLEWIGRLDVCFVCKCFLKFCVCSLFSCWYAVIYILICFGWFLLLVLSVSLYAFPVAFLLSTFAVPFIPFLVCFVLYSINSSQALMFIIILVYPTLANYIIIPFNNVLYVSFCAFLESDEVFVVVFGFILHAWRYVKSTIDLFVEYFGSILLSCYLRYVLEKNSILWGNIINDFWLLRYKLSTQVVYLWKHMVSYPVGWVSWYSDGQVNLWSDSLLNGFLYVSEGGALWDVGNIFSIVPSEHYPSHVKFFFFRIDNSIILKCEDFFYKRFVYVIFIFNLPLYPRFVLYMFFFHLFCYYVVPFFYLLFCSLVFSFFKRFSFSIFFPSCVMYFVEFDEILCYVGYCYVWYTWLVLSTFLWPICKVLFCLISLPERILVISFCTVNATWEFCLYMLVNRIVFLYFAVPVTCSDIWNCTGEFADCYSCWQVSNLWSNSSSIMSEASASDKSRFLSRKAAFVRYMNSFVLGSKLCGYWFLLTGVSSSVLDYFVPSIVFVVTEIWGRFFFFIFFLMGIFLYVVCCLCYLVGVVWTIFVLFMTSVGVLYNEIYVWVALNVSIFYKGFFSDKYMDFLFCISQGVSWINSWFCNYGFVFSYCFYPVIRVVGVFWFLLMSVVLLISYYCGPFVEELSVLLIWLYLVNPSANISRMEGSNSWFEFIWGILRFVCSLVLVVISFVMFEVVLFFNSVSFAYRIYKEGNLEGRGMVYWLNEVVKRMNNVVNGLNDGIRSSVEVLKNGCKVNYNIYNFYLDMFMLTFVFTPDELENLLLPNGQRSGHMQPGDYVSKVSEWYAFQTRDAPVTFMEFLEEDVVGVHSRPPKDCMASKGDAESASKADDGENEAKDYTKAKNGSMEYSMGMNLDMGSSYSIGMGGYSYEAEDRRNFLWTYRHFFSIWTSVGSCGFFVSWISNIVRPTTSTASWYEW